MSIWAEKNLEQMMKRPILIGNGECDITGKILMRREERLEKGITETNIIKGVYVILNKINNKFYIGSSNKIITRWNDHVNLLSKNIHKNSHLQSAWNLYGPENFKFLLIEKFEDNISTNVILEVEQYLLNQHFGNENCYNKQKRAFMDDESALQRISKKLIGHKMSYEIKSKISRSLKGRKWSKSEKEKNSYKIKVKNLDTDEVLEFYSVKEAERKLNIRGGALRQFINPKYSNKVHAKRWIVVELNGNPFMK